MIGKLAQFVVPNYEGMSDWIVGEQTRGERISIGENRYYSLYNCFKVIRDAGVFKTWIARNALFDPLGFLI